MAGVEGDILAPEIVLEYAPRARVLRVAACQRTDNARAQDVARLPLLRNAADIGILLQCSEVVIGEAERKAAGASDGGGGWGGGVGCRQTSRKTGALQVRKEVKLQQRAAAWAAGDAAQRKRQPRLRLQHRFSSSYSALPRTVGKFFMLWMHRPTQERRRQPGKETRGELQWLRRQEDGRGR